MYDGASSITTSTTPSTDVSALAGGADISKSEELAALLAAAQLGRHAARLAEEGYTEVAELAEVADDELTELVIQRVEIRRFRKA